jgi:hypothetical protein
MPDYAPTFTSRLHWLYACQGKNHVATFRFQITDTIELANAHATELVTAMTAFAEEHFYTDLETRGWEWAEADSTVFIPIPSPEPPVGGVSTTGRPPNQIAMQCTLPYRTIQGGHGFFNFYGTNFNVYGTPEQDFRVLASEDSAVADLITNFSPIGFRGGDNQEIIIKPYVNIGFNARWKRKVRNG